MAAATPILETQLPAIRALEVRVDPLVLRAQEFSIESQEHYEKAADFLRDCKTMQKDIRETMDPAVKKAHEAHKAVTSIRSKLLDPIDQAESVVKRKMGAWIEEQERAAREERLRLEQEARKAEEERRLREAAELEARGEAAAADDVLAAPIVAPVILPEVQKATAEGTSTRKRYTARVVDTTAFLRAVVAHPHLAGLAVPNQQALDALAASLKEALSIPGVELKVETVIAAKGR